MAHTASTRLSVFGGFFLRKMVSDTIFYHGVDARGHYRLGALLTDLREPWRVLARSRSPILEPRAWYERKGFVPNVCFTCGALVRQGDLWVYYGGADRVVAVARAPIREILRELLRKPNVSSNLRVKS